MPRKIIFSLFIFAVMAGLQSCQIGEREAKESMVSVSILPVQYFVDRLTDASLEVNVMVQPGASHATYAPTASQLQKLSDSGIYFRIGHLGYEQAYMNRLSEISPGMRVVNLSYGVDLIRGEEIDHGDHVHEGGIDPHIWMSPAVMLSRLPVIKEAIVEVYPGLSAVADERYDELYADIEKIHHALVALAGELEHKSFMIFHPALTYIARDYGFKQIPIERHGKEPSPALLAHIIREARSDNVSLIFIQEEFDVRSAQVISEETGATIVQINPLAYDWKDGLEHIMNVFKTHLR